MLPDNWTFFKDGGEFDKNFLLYFRLEGTEEKFRNRESRPEDLQVIAELKDMVAEREALVKKLVVSVFQIV